MRKIKFRGKSIDFNNWVYGFYLEQDVYNAGSKNTRRDIIGKNMGLIVRSSKFTSATPVQKSTVGQYTGLKDKNGKEIYEGDIVKIGKDRIATIKWGKYCGFKIDYIDSIEWVEFSPAYLRVCQIVGNIYENKNLLEE